MRKKRKYNIIEALKLMDKGKVLSREGQNHYGGYYYKIYCGSRLVEHNGDGSIYNDNADLLSEILEYRLNKRYWIIIKLNEKGEII